MRVTLEWGRLGAPHFHGLGLGWEQTPAKAFTDEDGHAEQAVADGRGWAIRGQAPRKQSQVNMNAINHAATALAINRRWPGVPIVPVLISVQVVELLWVVLNLLGIERTELGPVVASMKDVHLVHMPYSHSLATTGALAVGVWFFFSKLLNKAQWGAALGMGVFSHTILDLLVHSHDMAIAPGVGQPMLGTGLYDVPMVALFVETIFGILCWKYHQGSKALLAVILVFNIGAISFYSADIPGPEVFMAERPDWFAAFIGIHIVMGLAAIWLFGRSTWRNAA